MTGYYLAFNFQVSHVSTIADFPNFDHDVPVFQDAWAVSQARPCPPPLPRARSRAAARNLGCYGAVPSVTTDLISRGGAGEVLR